MLVAAALISDSKSVVPPEVLPEVAETLIDEVCCPGTCWAEASVLANEVDGCAGVPCRLATRAWISSTRAPIELTLTRPSERGR